MYAWIFRDHILLDTLLNTGVPSLLIARKFQVIKLNFKIVDFEIFSV